MFLNGIKYQISGTNETLSFKFENSESRFRNVLYHLESGDGSLLFPALAFALTGTPSTKVGAVMIYVADGNGDQWQVERRGGKSRFIKNRQIIDGDGETAFRHAMLDGLENESVIFDLFNLSYENSQLVSRRDVQLSPFQNFYQEKGREKLNQLIKSTCDFLGSSNQISLANLVNFANRSRSLRAEYKEANRNLIALKEKYGSLQDIDPSFIDSLEIEVDLLRALDREADFLRDPSTSFDVLKGKLKKINSKLKELCENNQISQLPSLDQDIQWDKVILILSRLQAYERLEQAYRSSVNYIDNMVKPLFKEHINSMKNFLSDDKRLLGDIEKSLQTLTLHLQVVEGSKAKEDRGVIAKIFGGEKPKAGHDVHIDPHVLDSSRQSVDQVLRSLGAMCSNLEMTTSSYTDGFDGIQERYEKIVKELGGCKKEWLTISKKYNFDPNSNLKSMLNLINNLSQISSLYSKKLDVKQTLSLYSNRLRRLERKICDWRSLTGSQKSNDLSQVPILINEIRNMIQYKEKKEAQLRKAQKVKAKVDFCRGLKSSYEASIRSCQSKWSSNFSLLDLDPIEIGSKNWEKFFLLVDQAKACSELLKMNSSHLKNEEIVSTQNLIAPLNILKILGTESEARFEFLRQLEFLSPHSNVLILLEDKKLAEMLSKMDVGTSLPLKARNSKSINNSSNNKKSAGEPVMSERARTALELFKGRVADVSD